MVGGSDLEIVCELFVNSIRILWEFFGNSLGILWEFFGNSLGILWEFYWNSLGCWGVLNVWMLILGNLTLLGLKDKENDH